MNNPPLDSHTPQPGEMDTRTADPRALLRRSVYALLIMISTGSMLGRVLAVNSVDYIRLEKYRHEKDRPNIRLQRPFLSANDRSRWCTVRALVEHGTYAIDDVVREPNWDTIDVVKHDDEGNPAPEPDKGHLYSSKPTLLPTLIAGEYWLIHKLTGATLGTHPYAIGRGMIISINVLPMLLYFAILARWCERYGSTDWGRMFMMAGATCGTFLSTFAVVLNNHTVAAVSTAVALDASLRIWHDGDRRLRWFVIAGVFAALTAADELPALSFFAAMLVALAWAFPRQTLIAFAPGALIVVAAAVGTNYLAHHTLTPAYAHRKPGDNWYDFEYVRDKKVRQSYWSSNIQARSPIDQGEPSPGVYALHVLVGHHGIFSLTPIWLLSLVGVCMLVLRRQPNLRDLGLMIASVSLVCLAFYLTRGQEERNYGGMSSGFRWAFWFAPLWLLALLPAADALAQRRWTRALACVLLCLSVLSVSYPTWNPWTQPWLFDFLSSLNAVGLGNR